MVISGISYTIHYNKAPNQTWRQLFLLHKTVTHPPFLKTHSRPLTSPLLLHHFSSLIHLHPSIKRFKIKWGSLVLLLFSRSVSLQPPFLRFPCVLRRVRAVEDGERRRCKVGLVVLVVFRSKLHPNFIFTFLCFSLDVSSASHLNGRFPAGFRRRRAPAR